MMGIKKKDYVVYATINVQVYLQAKDEDVAEDLADMILDRIHIDSSEFKNDIDCDGYSIVHIEEHE